MTLEEILATPPEQWTDEDRNVILAAKKSFGHEYVKRLRDRIQSKLAENTAEIPQDLSANSSPASTSPEIPQTEEQTQEDAPADDGLPQP